MYYATEKRSEATEQIGIMAWCRAQESVSECLKYMYHCPNGGSRNKIEAGKLKKQGVKAGVPDLHLPIPKGKYCGLYIELKYADGTIQPSQKEWIKAMRQYGHFTCICYEGERAVQVIKEYINLPAKKEMSIANGSILKPPYEKVKVI